MRIGLVAEFNPLHTGHKYLISTARQIITQNGGGELICVMSEFFTQRGEVAVFNGYLRAKEAVLNGCDLVLALPYRASVAYSDDFAKKSVEILVKCGITHLIFGTEADIAIFQKLYAEEQRKETKIAIKKYLKEGYSYPAIMSKIFDLPSNKPNFILAYSYYKALQHLAPNVELISVKREGQNLNSENIEQTKYLSATAIRKNVTAQEVEKYVSKNMFQQLRTKKIIVEKEFYPYIQYNILALQPAGLRNIYDVSEGLENRIYKAVFNSNNYDELVNEIQTKRYSRKKVQRILLNIFTNTTAEEMQEDILAVRVLAVKKNKTYLIREINNLNELLLYQKLKKDNAHFFKHDIRVARQYALISKEQDIFKYNVELVVEEK